MLLKNTVPKNFLVPLNLRYGSCPEIFEATMQKQLRALYKQNLLLQKGAHDKSTDIAQ
jgi:hypothetical protein